MNKFEGPKSKIHRQWAGRISESKSILTELLTYTLLYHQSDFSPGQLAKKLDAAFLRNENFQQLFDAI